jgi:hypothetical protein
MSKDARGHPARALCIILSPGRTTEDIEELRLDWHQASQYQELRVKLSLACAFRAEIAWRGGDQLATEQARRHCAGAGQLGAVVQGAAG